VKQVELIRNGEPIPAPVERVDAGTLRIRAADDLAHSAWYALRVSGDKLGEAPLPAALPDWVVDAGDRYMNFREHLERQEAFYAGRGRVRPTAAHTAPIFVTVHGAPSLAAQPRGQALARAALERLAELEARLSDARLPEQTLWDWLPYSDGVSEEHLRRNRPALLAAIAEARQRYQALLDGAGR
jgi:hypothetical protein